MTWNCAVKNKSEKQKNCTGIYRESGSKKEGVERREVLLSKREEVTPILKRVEKRNWKPHGESLTDKLSESERSFAVELIIGP